MPIFAIVGNVPVGNIGVYSFFLGNDLNGVVVKIRVLFWSDLACQIAVCSWWVFFRWEIVSQAYL